MITCTLTKLRVMNQLDHTEGMQQLFKPFNFMSICLNGGSFTYLNCVQLYMWIPMTWFSWLLPKIYRKHLFVAISDYRHDVGFFCPGRYHIGVITSCHDLFSNTPYTSDQHGRKENLRILTSKAAHRTVSGTAVQNAIPLRPTWAEGELANTARAAYSTVSGTALQMMAT